MIAVSTVFTVYKGICWILDRYEVGKKRKLSKALATASRNNMREILRINHHQYAEIDGFITEDSLEHIEQVYDTYHCLGGNGTATRWMNEMRQLPREKPMGESE